MGNNEHLEGFCERHQTVLVKPLNGSSGRGIHTVSFVSVSEAEKKQLLQDLNSENVLVEELIDQKGVLHELNPSSVNTMRVNTLLDGGEVVFLNAWFRTGRVGQVTDNIHAGGILWTIDQKTGVVRFGAQADGNLVYEHPDSHIRVAGMEIPRFFEAIELCKQAQKKVPEVPQTGWDVVISDDYIALIEGNSGSGFWNSEQDRNLWKILREYLYRNNIKIKDRA